MIERLRASNEWKFAGVIGQADGLLAAAWWSLLVLRGLLPALFAIAMGILVGAVEQHGGLAAPLTLAGTVFVLLQVLPPIHHATGANLGGRIAAWLYDQLTQACVRPYWRRSIQCWHAATRAAPDLSGGPWQRIALARALCAVQLGAGVVLLDEPTAQLDVRGEAEIFDRILTATRHTTTILISPRFFTVRHADRIGVLEHGRVVESGGGGRPVPDHVRTAGVAL